jgi:hypothetical protein
VHFLHAAGIKERLKDSFDSFDGEHFPGQEKRETPASFGYDGFVKPVEICGECHEAEYLVIILDGKTKARGALGDGLIQSCNKIDSERAYKSGINALNMEGGSAVCVSG